MDAFFGCFAFAVVNAVVALVVVIVPSLCVNFVFVYLLLQHKSKANSNSCGKQIFFENQHTILQ